MKKPEISPLLRKILRARGVRSDKQLAAFLSPSYEDLHDPLLLPDMAKAASRLRAALDANEKIVIFGDYDADGVTSVAVLYLGLRELGFKRLAVSLPHRVKDGYGISREAVAKMQKAGATLAISVDCGSRDNEVIKELGEAGFDVIVTDHHEVSDELPPALAIVNPKRPDSKYPFRDLAGVGVAFKLVQALFSALGDNPKKSGQEKWLLDLVAIGTVCDCMPLVGENRILAHFGFKVLPKSRRKGLREIMRRTGDDGREVNSHLVGFRIGPRINAAGRLADPSLALRAFLSERAPDVASAVGDLEKLNEKRKSLQEKGAAQAISQIEALPKLPNVVFVRLPELHEGIIGIIAGRLVDYFKRPVWVFTSSDDGKTWKGSGRSFGDFSLAELMASAKGLYKRGGGHAEAAGILLESTKKLNDFENKANNLYAELKLSADEQERLLVPSPDVVLDNFSELSFDFASSLSLLEPFGNGNPDPLFKVRDVLVVGRKVLKEKYISFTVRDSAGEEFSLMAFRPETWWFEIENGAKLDILFTVEAHTWRDRKEVRGMVVSLSETSP